jgi:hypothetical protein
MAEDPGTLFVECQMALKLTQEELGELVGRTKRTIQRWQEKGSILLPSEAQRLADALRPVRPDLAERVLELGRESAAATGLTPPVAPAGPEVIEAIVRAAAEAAGASPDAMRPAIAAAFSKAEELGAEVDGIVSGLRTKTDPDVGAG